MQKANEVKPSVQEIIKANQERIAKGYSGAFVQPTPKAMRQNVSLALKNLNAKKEI